MEQARAHARDAIRAGYNLPEGFLKAARPIESRSFTRLDPMIKSHYDCHAFVKHDPAVAGRPKHTAFEIRPEEI